MSGWTCGKDGLNWISRGFNPGAVSVLHDEKFRWSTYVGRLTTPLPSILADSSLDIPPVRSPAGVCEKQRRPTWRSRSGLWEAEALWGACNSIPPPISRERCEIECLCQQKSNRKLHMAYWKLEIFDLWWTWAVSFIFRTLKYKISRERCEIECLCQQKTNKKLHMAFRKLKIFELWWTRAVSFIFRTLRYKISRERCEIECLCEQNSNRKLHMAFWKLKIFELWWTRAVSFIFRTLTYRISREWCEIECSCPQKTNKKLPIYWTQTESSSEFSKVH